MTRLQLCSGQRSNRVRFAAGKEGFGFFVASRLVFDPTSLLSKDYRKPFPLNRASGMFIEKFLVIFVISSETVYADVLVYVSLLKKCTNFIVTRNKTI